jgi:broad specificity phosphatase PhoE
MGQEDFENKITLIRHGKPLIRDHYSSFSIISGKGIEQFIKGWNTCELSSENEIPLALKDTISDGDLFLCSSLRRARESLQMLGVTHFKSNDLFNEAELPYGIGKKIKLPLIIWLIALRLFWRFGFINNSESYADFIWRMEKTVDFLEKEKEAKHIVLMAHGFVNRIIRKELLRRNWKVLSNNGGNGFWSFSTFGRL